MADEGSRLRMDTLDGIVERYLSLEKVNEQGEDYVEVRTVFLPSVPSPSSCHEAFEPL